MINTQHELQLGEKLRDNGMDLVEWNNLEWIDRIRKVARHISDTKGSVSADDLRRYAIKQKDHPRHVNAWGGVFRGKTWHCVGRKKSTITSCHARQIMVWKYIGF